MVMGELSQEAELLVVGGGPGGYGAAFRAADLGMDVTLVDIMSKPGGVCLYRGCIPSKTLLFTAEILHDAARAEAMGLRFGKPEIDLDKLRDWKDEVVGRLTDGLWQLSRRRGIQLIQGRAVFEGPDTVRLQEAEVGRIRFGKAVIATGSRVTGFPGVTLRKGGRIMTSTGALELAEIPDTLLVVGGGYVGLELGSVYASLGSRVTLVEMADALLPGADPDLVKPLRRRLDDQFEAVRLQTRIEHMEEDDDGVAVSFAAGGEDLPQRFDRVLVAIGRKANTSGLGLEKAVVETDENGFVLVDERQQTSNDRIYAVGDITGGVMLAHKATREGKVAAEAIAGRPSAFDVRAIPAVVYTDPQVAWAGLTERQARAEGIDVQVQRFPWKASGRAVTMGLDDGLTKLVVEADTGRILGIGVAGRDAEGLIAEGVLAIEMGALAEDVALTVHPHPTLSETEGEAAEIFHGSPTHIIASGKKRSEAGKEAS